MSVGHRASQPSAGARITRRAALHLGVAATASGLATTALPATPATACTTVGARRSPGQAPSTPFDALDAQMRAAMAEAGVPGAAVGVLYRGEEYVAGYGVTNVDYPLPVDADTLFQVGSLTKTFTMAAAMRLVEQGRLELDTPIRRYLPDLQMSQRVEKVVPPSAEASGKSLLGHEAGPPVRVRVLRVLLSPPGAIPGHRAMGRRRTPDAPRDDGRAGSPGQMRAARAGASAAPTHVRLRR